MRPSQNRGERGGVEMKLVAGLGGGGETTGSTEVKEGVDRRGRL